MKKLLLVFSTGILSLLASLGVPADQVLSPKSESPLIDAAEKGNLAQVNKLIAAGANVDATDTEGMTALHKAVRRGHIKVVERLLAENPPTNLRAGKLEETPLHLAMPQSNKKIVTMLLNASANPNIANKVGYYPIMPATIEGRGEILAILLNANANHNVTDKEGRTPLIYAAQNKNAQAVDTLLKVGAKVDDTDERGITALMYAAYGDSEAVVKRLLEAKANLFLKNTKGILNPRHDQTGLTALDFAKSEAIRKILQEAMDEENIRGASALEG